jgi:hypothetical protein
LPYGIRKSIKYSRKPIIEPYCEPVYYCSPILLFFSNLIHDHLIIYVLIHNLSACQVFLSLGTCAIIRNKLVSYRERCQLSSHAGVPYVPFRRHTWTCAPCLQLFPCSAAVGLARALPRGRMEMLRNVFVDSLSLTLLPSRCLWSNY